MGRRKYPVVAVGYSEKGVNYLGVFAPGEDRRFHQVHRLSGHGEQVTLKVRDRGKVTLTLEQGIDDRKPLFTLYVTRPKAARPRWLAWSPHGPYDASDVPALEKNIEWQVNPEKPGGKVETSGA